MRDSFAMILTLLTIVSAILLPMGRVVEVVRYHSSGPPYFMGFIDLSISRLDILGTSYPGIEFVFILWILVALIQTLNLLLASRGMLSAIISWLVFLPSLVAQIYIPSLVLDLALPNPFLVSQVSEPNVLCSIPAALGLVLISLRNRQKSRDKQWTRIGLS
jgi:hypothetical protein